MSGTVLKPSDWLNRTLMNFPNLHTDSNLPFLKELINFLQLENLYMSVIGEGRTTKNSSIYFQNSTDPAFWLCDIKFFENGETKLATIVDIIGKEKMNTVGIVYENSKFSRILEVLTELKMQKVKNAQFKTKISINNFKTAMETLKKAISIHLTYQR
jgi:hypothetical protein